MQYILSQEEYDDLKRKREVLEEIDRKELQSLCTKLSNEMLIQRTDLWGKPYGDPVAIGCILDAEGHRDWDSGNEYCDYCPVQKICPYPHKSWSK